MGIIKALKLGFDYQRYDDDGNVVDMQRAVNDVNLDIKQENLWQFWDITDPENPHWRSI